MLEWFGSILESQAVMAERLKQLTFIFQPLKIVLVLSWYLEVLFVWRNTSQPNWNHINSWRRPVYRVFIHVQTFHCKYIDFLLSVYSLHLYNFIAGKIAFRTVYAYIGGGRRQKSTFMLSLWVGLNIRKMPRINHISFSGSQNLLNIILNYLTVC